MKRQRFESHLEGSPELLQFVKYPKIPYLGECPDIIGHKCYLFEKIDGSLSQVRMTDEGVLVGGSKANYITGSTARPHWAPEFLKWMHSNNSLYNIPGGLIVFGEWLDPVTVEYNEDKLNKFYFLDMAVVGESNEPVFFDYNEAVQYLRGWNVKGVEILSPIAEEVLTFEYVREFVNSQQSMLGPEIEGVVLKNYRIDKFAKFLHPKSSEKREEEKGLEKYVNPPRVNKAIRRIRDRGILKIGLEDVVCEVASDIAEETGEVFSHDSVRGLMRIRNLYHSPNH